MILNLDLILILDLILDAALCFRFSFPSCSLTHRPKHLSVAINLYSMPSINKLHSCNYSSELDTPYAQAYPHTLQTSPAHALRESHDYTWCRRP